MATVLEDPLRGLQQGNTSPTKRTRRRVKGVKNPLSFLKRKSSQPAALEYFAGESQYSRGRHLSEAETRSVTPSESISAVNTPPNATPLHASATASHVSASPYESPLLDTSPAPVPKAKDPSPASSPFQYAQLSPDQRECSFARLLNQGDTEVVQEEQEQQRLYPEVCAESGEPKEQHHPRDSPSDVVALVEKSSTSVVLSQEDSFQLAMYIAMAHAALILAGLTLYFLGLLLKDFWWPILWALLCSMPLREVQDWIVGFWEPRLQSGLGPALVSPLLIVCNSVACTTLDIRDGLRRFAGRWVGGWWAGNSLGTAGREEGRRKNATPSTAFERLSNWMLTFAVVTVGYDIIGLRGLATGAVGVAAYFYLKSRSRLDAVIEQQREKATATLQHFWSFITAPITAPYQLLDHRISQYLLGSIRFLVAVALIVGMVFGSLSLSLFFSYRIALEGKEAVVSLNTHVRSSNYAEKFGVNQWLEENHVVEMIDTYSDKAYQVVSDQIDSLASAYNLTTYVDAAKLYLTRGHHSINDSCEADMTAVSLSMQENPVLLTLQSVKVKLVNSEYKAAYEEAQAALVSVLGQYNINKEELMAKAKTYAARAAESGKAFVMGGGSLLANGMSTFASFGKAVASGAADVVNFVAQSFFFFSVLYYLMVSESGGVWEQVLGMIPLSEKTRERSATVLNNAVSAVLLSTVKTSIFQTLFTWLLLRFFRIHFLYMSTLFAALSVIPIFPLWLASVPAGLELILSRRYITAGALVIFHQWAMGYGEGSIKDDIPDYNPSLMSLSIAGGMALFHSASQGAILGPLIMTMLLAVKNLYAEFVLGV